MSRKSGASMEAIQHHYDVSNKFYELWLDSGMVYSSALWYGDESLEEAQINKLKWHLDHAGAGGAKRLLDIGCGWGSLLKKAVDDYGVEEAVGLSLSAEQIDYINADERNSINAKLQNWMDHKPGSKYDAIVSIGAFEHFARLDQSTADKIIGYRNFFKFCRDSLNEGGRLSLQTISYENSEREDFSDFFANEIFPESDLPNLAEIAEASKGLFEIEVLRNDRTHYADTLREWLRRLRANKAVAIELVGEQVYMRYEKYLGIMVLAFHAGTMNLTRIAFKRIGKPSLKLTGR